MDEEVVVDWGSRGSISKVRLTIASSLGYVESLGREQWEFFVCSSHFELGFRLESETGVGWWFCMRSGSEQKSSKEGAKGRSLEWWIISSLFR